MLSRLLRTSIKTTRATTGTIVTRNFSNVVQDRQRGEEEQYIKRIESERQQKLRLQLDELLSREKSDPARYAVEQAIESSKPKASLEEVGFLRYYGLDDWRMALPVGLLIGTPIFGGGIIVFDAKMFHIAAFAMTWHVYKAVVLPLYNEKLGWVEDYYMNIWKKLDDKAAAQIDSAISTHEELVDIKESMEDVYKLTDDIQTVVAHSINLEAKNTLQKAIVKKLDALVTLDETVRTNIRADMVATVKQDAVNTLKTDKKVKEAVLNQAIACLASGANGKRGKDIVGEVFLQSTNKYKTSSSNKDHGIHKIAAQLEKDIAEIVKEPVVYCPGGNSYDFFPIFENPEIPAPAAVETVEVKKEVKEAPKHH